MTGTNYGPHWAGISALVRAAGRCARCGGAFPPDQLNAHHKIPRDEGGPDTVPNLEPLCDACHPQAEREAEERVQAIRRLVKRRGTTLRPHGARLADRVAAASLAAASENRPASSTPAYRPTEPAASPPGLAALLRMRTSDLPHYKG